LTDIDVIDAPAGVDVERAARAALAATGVGGEAHLAVAFVGPSEIAELNAEHRGIDAPTDVLSFPIDEDGIALGPRELGDVVICPAHTEDLTEAVVHGVLHLCGLDHETDSGEMLALQDQVMAELG
jgi:probable rRNA maturation factor